MLVSLQDISKNYSNKKVQTQNALSSINLSFPNCGLVAIIGKSGSGKSTLLNILGFIDKQSGGHYFFDNEDTSSWNKKKISNILNSSIGIIFQNYQLLDDLTSIENVALPMIIGGNNKKSAYNDAKTLLDGIGFSEELANKKVSLLSGGERQRIAILRSLINNPKMILCDEPTGALDSDNSIKVMEMLKKASIKHLVIVVSHNKELIEKYADRIITLSNGQVISDDVIAQIDQSPNINATYKKRKNTSWIDNLAEKNFKRRRKRNLISIFSLSFALLVSTLVLGFVLGAGPTVKNEEYHHLDYGVMTISKESSKTIDNSFVSLVKQLRPNNKELIELKNKNKSFIYELNYDAIIPASQKLAISNSITKEAILSPIYSFNNNSYDKSFLKYGRFPNSDNLYEVVININLYNKINDCFEDGCLNKSLHLHTEYKNTFYTLNQTNDVIEDYLIFDKSFKIVGVVDELSFLSSPRLYYSHLALDNYLSNLTMNNMSEYYGYRYSWKDLVTYATPNSAVSSYSYRVYLKDISQKELVHSLNDEGFTYSNNAITVSNALNEIVDAAKMGIEIFLIITIIGAILILGIISFSSFSDDVKRSAILSSIGARNSDIVQIYMEENLFVGMISLCIGVLLSFPSIIGVNKILELFTGINTFVIFPRDLIASIPFSYFLIILLSLLVTIMLSTLIPIIFSKKLSIREELQKE